MPTAKKSASKAKTSQKKITSPKVEMKRPARVKPAPNDLPSSYSIHIYGYGETQLIEGDISSKMANSDLKALQPFIDYLSAHQQKGTKISLENTHAINVFSDKFVEFRSSNEKNKNQRFMWGDIDKKSIERLKKELSK